MVAGDRGAAQLTVVMYHYVRDLARSRYPRIKGLTLEKFRGQLAYLDTRYEFVRVQDVLAALADPADPAAALPPRAVLLTFDDGYADHFRYVTPILDELGLQGCFFPPLGPLRDRVVLDVNKIHFSLAASGDAEDIATYCLRRVEELRDEFGLETPEAYLAAHRHPSRLDDAATIFVKRLLQRGLPLAARARITDEVFRRFVTDDEAAFAEELYLTDDQVGMMDRAGMFFGSHCVSHRWLDSLDEEEQRWEVETSRALLDGLGYPADQRVIAYPYGGHDETTLAVTRAAGYAAAFTTEVRVADPAREDPLRIPRLDTVDLPYTPDD